jgi:hypothetical protein
MVWWRRTCCRRKGDHVNHQKTNKLTEGRGALNARRNGGIGPRALWRELNEREAKEIDKVALALVVFWNPRTFKLYYDDKSYWFWVNIPRSRNQKAHSLTRHYPANFFTLVSLPPLYRFFFVPKTLPIPIYIVCETWSNQQYIRIGNNKILYHTLSLLCTLYLYFIFFVLTH